MKVAVIGGVADMLVKLRGHLLSDLVQREHAVEACGVAATKKMKRHIGSLGASYRDLDLNPTGLNPLDDRRSIDSIRRFYRDCQPDVVFSYTVKPVIFSCLAAETRGNPRVYPMITGLGYGFGGETMRQKLVASIVRSLYRRALKRCCGVFFQNPDDQDLFFNRKLLPRSTPSFIVNGSGVDIDHFTPVALPERLVFLMVARLLKDKGVHEYVEAARLAKKHYPESHFILAGDLHPNPLSISADTLAGWMREGVVEHIPQFEDVRTLIARASVYVLPSYREGTPRTVLEAMAMARPIITTRVPGCKETVVDGLNGFLVPARDPRHLFQAMERFIERPEMVREMGWHSRTIACNKYDVRKINAFLMECMKL
jgi:glycosyltransferase involved in cell wall biosynthesis